MTHPRGSVDKRQNRKEDLCRDGSELRFTDPMDITLRPARSTDADFLTTMLVAAAFWRVDGPSGTVEGVLHNPELAHYVADWPQSGDIGVVAEMDQPVGAAWLRYFTVEDPRCGFVDSSIPEVAMGVVRDKRGAGVGRSMLNALIAAAAKQPHRR